MNISNFSYLIRTLAIISISNGAAAFHDLSLIEDEVKEFIQQKYKNNTQYSDIKYDVSQIDPRLKLSQCDRELTYSMKSYSQKVSNVTVQASCEGAKPWTIYIPSKIVKYLEVVVTKRNISRGETINAGDLELASKEVRILNTGYFLNMENAIGMVSKRPIRKNEVVRQSNMAPPLLVAKGDYVKITAAAGQLSVSTNGIALTKGREGEQIKVRNIGSEKILRARVTGIGRVNVIL